jgi:hypothetical protein
VSKVSDASLTAVVAEKVFGWKDVHERNGELIGKKPDKLGRWRLAKVPPYSTDPALGYAIDARMKQLGQGERYAKELARTTKEKNLPNEWATPEQRSKAAVKILDRQRRTGHPRRLK